MSNGTVTAVGVGETTITAVSEDGLYKATCNVSVSASDDNVVDSGEDANGILWSLDSKGILKIAGMGKMEDYSKPTSIPWYAYRNEIKEVFFDEGITHIATRAMYNCTLLQKAYIARSVVSIGNLGFGRCDDVSIYGYKGTYGKTSLVSHLYPAPNGTVLGTYTDIYPRTTYQVHHKDSNGNDVYMLNGETVSRTTLEHDLLERAVNAVSSQITEELNVDIDKDNYVDSVTFIIAGNSGAWNTLLWSHKWSMYRNAYINSKRVSTYTFVMENEVRPNGRYNSVLQHELFHLYGAPDLYHYKSGYGTVVGRWDNMDNSAPEPYEDGPITVNWIDTKIKQDYDGVRAKMYKSDNGVTISNQNRPSTGGGGTRTRYTVTFNTNGGSSISSKTINKNAVVSEPAQPQKEEYTFAGWYMDKEMKNQYDFSSKVTKNITLYAKWESIDNAKSQIIFEIGKKEATVFGETKTNDVAPIIKNGSSFLPVRFVAESLGANVEWDEAARKVIVIKEDIKIVITIGADTAKVNNETVVLDYPAFIDNDRTYTPIRFVAEKLGGSVDWNSDKQLIIIKK